MHASASTPAHVQPQFSHLYIEHALSQNNAPVIAQDHQWYIQVASEEGNRHGIGSDKKHACFIIILPSWIIWWTKLILVTLPAALYSYRTRIIGKRKRLLESTVKARTRELIAEKHRIEVLLQRKSKELENISHEFRTPLAIIMGAAQQQLTRETSEQSRCALAAIDKVTRQLALTVDDVIEMAKMSHDYCSDQKQLICVSTLLTELCDKMEVFASVKRQQFDSKIAENIHQRCIPKTLEKLFSNLISNAIKYTEEGGSVSVQLTVDGRDYYRLTVKDNGIGIPIDQQPKIYERFFRCDNASSLQVHGSGIGLSLVKDVVEAHGGTISLLSEPENGSEFIVRLPMDPIGREVSRYTVDFEHLSTMMHSDLPACANQLGDKGSLASTKPVVLLAEDNTDMRLLVQQQLVEHYRIICASNGVKALKLALAEIPDIVVCDVSMPLMDGYTLLGKLKRHPATSHIPVVLLTAKADVPSRVTGFECGADGYLCKPYDSRELLALLKMQRDNRDKVRRHAAKLLESGQSLRVPAIDEHGNKAINRCIDYIRQHYKNTQLSIKKLADVACLSERQLLRKFKDVVGMSPTDYINDYRLQLARPMILKGNRVNEVSSLVGYSSANYFSRLYKKKFGQSPTRDVDV